MDHHCVWINACVGHENHTSFIAFLFFLPIGCIYAVIINANFLYRLFSRVSVYIVYGYRSNLVLYSQNISRSRKKSSELC